MKKKKLKKEEELNKEKFIFTKIDTTYRIEEEEQEETLPNIIQEKKFQKEKILNLEIITSSYISKGTNLKLTPEGYEKGLRKIKDGVTYFGYEELDKNNTDNVSIFKYKIFSLK